MTLLHFDLRKPELIFFKIQKISQKATKSTQKASY